MSDTLDYRPLMLPRARKSVAGRLKALLSAVLNRGAGAPTRIRPADLSGHMLKDIGLDARNLQRDRPPMGWPTR